MKPKPGKQPRIADSIHQLIIIRVALNSARHDPHDYTTTELVELLDKVIEWTDEVITCLKHIPKDLEDQEN